MTSVIALGGNALMRPGERGTAAEQLANLRDTLPALADILASGPAVVTHGNGPQVGNMLLRQERAAEEVPPHPLWLAVAETQAEIGALVAIELRELTERPVACLLTHVVVDEHDPAFGEPTKPVGPFYDEMRARQLARERGWAVSFDAGRGWRRLVPSPAPLEIIEIEAVRTLLEAGTIAVACGGGGIPVARGNGRLAGLDAVIDKDRASALLATELGAERLLIVTDVPGLFRAFGTPDEERVRELTAQEAEALLPELEAGSMRPKIEAAIAFVRRTNGEATITSAASLASGSGTRISAP